MKYISKHLVISVKAKNETIHELVGSSSFSYKDIEVVAIQLVEKFGNNLPTEKVELETFFSAISKWRGKGFRASILMYGDMTNQVFATEWYSEGGHSANPRVRDWNSGIEDSEKIASGYFDRYSSGNGWVGSSGGSNMIALIKASDEIEADILLSEPKDFSTLHFDKCHEFSVERIYDINIPLSDIPLIHSEFVDQKSSRIDTEKAESFGNFHKIGNNLFFIITKKEDVSDVFISKVENRYENYETNRDKQSDRCSLKLTSNTLKASTVESLVNLGEFVHKCNMVSSISTESFSCAEMYKKHITSGIYGDFLTMNIDKNIASVDLSESEEYWDILTDPFMTPDHDMMVLFSKFSIHKV